MKSSVVIVLLLYFGSVSSNFMNDMKCGLVASDNPIHQHPWLVLIEYYPRGGRALVRCGGTLIDSRHILTSAHCLEIIKKFPGGRRSVTILPRLGEFNTSSHRDCVAGVCSDPVIRMVVESVIVHPMFYRDHVSHDLAILVLEAEAPYTDFIRPVCLLRRTSEIPTELYASGFGVIPNSEHPSQVKKNIRLPYYPICPRAYKQTAYKRIHKLPKDGFCAGGEAFVDTCTGDSGGPIIWLKEDGGRRKAELWGVIKGGTKSCGLKDKPGVYTSVSKNLVWIRKTVIKTYLKQQNKRAHSERNKIEEKRSGGKPNEENVQDHDKTKHIRHSSEILRGSDYYGYKI